MRAVIVFMVEEVSSTTPLVNGMALAGTSSMATHSGYFEQCGVIEFDDIPRSDLTQQATPASITERFIQALCRFEQSGEKQDLIDLFANDAELQTLMMPAAQRGLKGVEEFWHAYRASFREISSEFTRITEKGDLAVLEWVSKGARNGGETVRYRGVTILECQNDRICVFHSYFDSAALLGQHRDNSVKNPEKSAA